LGAGCVHYTPKPLSLSDAAHSFDSRTLSDAGLQSFITTRATNQPAPISHWNLETLVLAAYYFNPTLELARVNHELGEAGRSTAKARPNPTLGLSPGYDFNSINPASPWIPGMTIDYPVETAGKRNKRMLVARFNAESTRWAVAAMAWQVRSNVHAALIERCFAAQREQLIQQQLTNQTALVGLLHQRLEAGAVTRFEITPFEIALTRLQNDFASVRSASIAANAHLAEAIGVPAKALDGLTIEELDFAKTAPANISELRAEALRHRADLLSLLARYEAAQAALQLEIAKQYPDVRLGSGYQWDQGESKWNLSLNLEIPIFNRNQGPIAEAEIRRKQATAEVMEAQARIINQIDRAAAALAAAQEEASRSEKTFAALKEQSKSVRERFSIGAADQVETVTALLEQSAASLTALDSQARLAFAAAELEAALQSQPISP
jgi:cobalt-zinc-cadmium efflux system outer membrane protein